MSFHTFSAIQASLVKILGTALDARITGPLLIAILYYPEKLKSILPTNLQSWVSHPMVVKALAVILGIDILRKANNKFSDLVLNNFKTVKFVPSEELVLITGGASGIGLIMAKEFSSKGAKVVIIDINSPAEELPTNIFFYKSDVTSPSKIAATAAEIRKDHGDPTVLINNAGVGSCLSILDGTETTIQRTFEVNTVSHFWLVREFLPAMIRKDHGHVVTIASLAGYIVHAYNVDYACTKASAGAFHEGLHSELRNKYKAPHVRTTLVNPSWTKTPLIEPLYTNPEWKGHAMEPEEVTSVVVDQVLSGRGGHLIIPKEFNPISTLRGWPSWLQYGFRNFISLELDRVKFSRADKWERLEQGKK